MTILERLAVASIAVGAVAGAVWGGMSWGVAGAVIGMPVGALLGWLALFALPLLLVCGAVAVVIRIRYGRRAARHFLWWRAD